VEEEIEMKPELEEKLFEKYPKIFAGKDKPITENLMAFGFECGDGWCWLIDKLCSSIQSYCDGRNEEVRIRNESRKIGKLDGEEESEWQVEATQVKEKFGGLRFYINWADDFVFGMIQLAESMSYHICEECGSVENVKQTTRGWIKTLCCGCTKEYEKKRKGE
jgi:hypothetical protein